METNCSLDKKKWHSIEIFICQKQLYVLHFFFVQMNLVNYQYILCIRMIIYKYSMDEHRTHLNISV